jgi:hypothetical protein
VATPAPSTTAAAQAAPKVPAQPGATVAPRGEEDAEHHDGSDLEDDHSGHRDGDQRPERHDGRDDDD